MACSDPTTAAQTPTVAGDDGTTVAAAGPATTTSRWHAERVSYGQRRGRRGYVLLTIVVLTVLILLGASVLLLVAKEASVMGIKEKRSTEAYGVALAGLQWAFGNLWSQDAKEAVGGVVAQQTAAGVLVKGKHVFPFNQNLPFAGAPTARPAKGASTTAWTAVGAGHYALLADVDPLNPAGSITLRAIGVVGDGEVVLESTITLNMSQSVPAALVGCFSSANRLEWMDSIGPYDYVGNVRLDGGPGFPVAVSTDAPLLNGFVKTTRNGSTPAVSRPVGYPSSRLWRGTQSLRVDPTAEAVPGIRVAVENRFGGASLQSLKTDYTGPPNTGGAAGPPAGYGSNAYLAFDPRIVDIYSTSGTGLGLNGSTAAFPGGLWDGRDYKNSVATPAEFTQAKGLPLLAYLAAPPPSATVGGSTSSAMGLLGQDIWSQAGNGLGNASDETAARGFYSCRTTASNSLTEAVEECVKGSSGNTRPNWNDVNGPVNTSGRAWSIVSSVVRQCTGSGRSVSPGTGRPWRSADNPNGIKCARGFEWLENVAACLVLPRTILQSVDANDNDATQVAFNTRKPPLDAGGVLNDFDGCHPGCLVAVDGGGDGQLDSADRPFRSVCLNLDPTVSTVYGPGAIEDLDMYNTGERGFPGTGTGWAAGADKTATATLAYASPTGGAGPSGWMTFNRTTAPTVTGAGVFKTVNPTTGVAVTPGLRGGFIREPGNPAYITRLDLSDRGPLGTCEQNCLAYGFGQDVTYGAHRVARAGEPNPVTPQPAGVVATAADRVCTAQVPLHTDPNQTGFGAEVCNLDYDADGLLDRKSYALVSSYREECASPNTGVPYAPFVDISSDNEHLIGAGCRNRMPNHHPDRAPAFLNNFCDSNGDTAFQQALSDLSASARLISAGDLVNQSGGDPVDGKGWFGGAKCHVGTRFRINGIAHTHTGNATGLPVTDLDRLDHQDFWMEDSCPNPVILRVNAGSDMLAGQTCGCGILIVEDSGLRMQVDTFFLWRGLVIWNVTGNTSRSIELTKARGTTFYVDGGMIATGSAKLSFVVSKDAENLIATQPDTGSPQTAKVMVRLNRLALDEAFQAVPQPLRTIRRLR
jgi:hypothetical protein